MNSDHHKLKSWNVARPLRDDTELIIDGIWRDECFQPTLHWKMPASMEVQNPYIEHTSVCSEMVGRHALWKSWFIAKHPIYTFESGCAL